MSDSQDDYVVIDDNLLADFNPEQILPQTPDALLKIHSWLQPTAYSDAGSEYQKHLASHVIGTGEWLTATEKYQEWLTSKEYGALVVSGVAGSGKSVMAAHLIQQFASSASKKPPILYFFFRQIIKSNHSPDALLRDWLSQILDYSPPVQLHMKAEWIDKGRPIDSISRSDLWKALLMSFTSFPKEVFCVVDALDEMELDRDGQQFLSELGDMAQWFPDRVKLLITSRPTPPIKDALRNKKYISLRLQERLVDVDIALYVKHCLEKSEISRDEWKIVQDAVPGRANGLFLYAKLAMTAFLSSAADVTTAMAQLPQDLNAMYANLLAQHSRRSGVAPDIQNFLLYVATHSIRPLRLIEMAEMVKNAYPGRSIQNLKVAKALVRSACGPLLEILADETVSVLHHSFTEYLRGDTGRKGTAEYPLLILETVHARLAVVCVQYLLSGCLDTVYLQEFGGQVGGGEGNWARSTEEWFAAMPYNVVNKNGEWVDGFAELLPLKLQYPLLEYAANNWHHHVNLSDQRLSFGAQNQDEVSKQMSLMEDVIDQLLGNEIMLQKLINVIWPGSGSMPPKKKKADRSISTTRTDVQVYRVESAQLSCLHIAARLGLVSYTKRLLPRMKDKGLTIDPTDSLRRTPLWWAARTGHSEMIHELLVAGACSNKGCSGELGCNPMHAAAIAGNCDAVSVLIGAGVDAITGMQQSSNHHETYNEDNTVQMQEWNAEVYPFLLACGAGHVSVIDVMLPYISDTFMIQLGLSYAAVKGQSAVVGRLLQIPSIDVNFQIMGDTPLYLACNTFDLPSIKLLLKAGADATIICVDVWSRLMRNRRGTPESKLTNCLHSICGARDFLGAILRAAPQDIEEAVGLFIAAGVNVNQRMSGGKTALHVAVAHFPLQTRLLLQAGANANIKDDQGYVPIHDQDLHLESLVALVEIGDADIHLVGPDGSTPLMSTLRRQLGRDRASKLVEYGADCTAVDANGNSVLHEALSHGGLEDPELLQALLDGGADPNLRRRKDGLLPIHLLWCHEKVNVEMALDLLLAAGADIDAVDAKGQSELFSMLSNYAGSPHSMNKIEAFIARGASITFRDLSGRSMLHEYLVSHHGRNGYQPPIVCLDTLIDQFGLDIHAVDVYGNTLLHELAQQYENHFDNEGEILQFWTHLVNSRGIRLDAINNAGRTPLHILCSSHRSPRDLRSRENMLLPIEYVIGADQDQVDIDAVDQQGLTPLHLTAAAGADYYAQMLIRKGANVAALANGNVSVLHLAAIYGNTNIVGLFLSVLKDKGQLDQVLNLPMTSVATSTAAVAINKTPLYFACQSGRVESIQLLLSAGADCRKSSLLDAYNQFQKSNIMQPSRLRPMETIPIFNKKEDTEFPFDVKLPRLVLKPRKDRIPQYRQQTITSDLLESEIARLDDIFPLISISNDISETSQLEERGLEAIPSQRAQLQLWQDTKTHLRLLKGDMNRSDETNLQIDLLIDIITEWSLKNTSENNESTILDHFFTIIPADQQLFRWMLMAWLACKQYNLIKGMAKHGVDFLAISELDRQCNLAILVRYGFVSLVKEIATLQTQKQIQKKDPLCHAFGDTTQPGLYFLQSPNGPRPLILEAVSRVAPNMGMLQLLVAKFHVDINEAAVDADYPYGNPPQNSPLGAYVEESENLNLFEHFNTSAIHYVSSGCTWWYVNQALPYLLASGADVNLRDKFGRTPLHVALCERGLYYREAVEILLDAGADANAVNKDGKSCLMLATEDVDVIHLLLNHGANVTIDTIFGNMSISSAKSLETLLLHLKSSNKLEAVINGRSGKNDPFSSGQIPAIARDQYSLLYTAARDWHDTEALQATSGKTSGKVIQNSTEIVRLLVEYGADLCATFQLYEDSSPGHLPREEIVKENYSNTGSDLDADLGIGVSVPTGYQECTVAHEIFMMDGPVQPLLESGRLDPNHRDLLGRTLLHATCLSKQFLLSHEIASKYSKGLPIRLTRNLDRIDIVKRLFDLGFDWQAQDAYGRNCLHAMISTDVGKHEDGTRDQSLSWIVRKAPDLLHQADNLGYTPLHYAAERAVDLGDIYLVEFLIDHGADPFAVTKNGDTVLHFLATRAEHNDILACIERLVNDEGIDINRRNIRQETPLFSLFRPPLSINKVSGYRYKYGNDPQLRYKPMSMCNVPILQQLGADIFARDGTGRSLLHVAATGPAEVFRWLLDAGLDSKLEDDEQRTAIDIAAAANNKDVLALFRDKDD